MTDHDHSHYWPEPARTRELADGTGVTLSGLLAYATERTTHQGAPYATGVLRAEDGEIAFKVPPMYFRGVAWLVLPLRRGLVQPGMTRTVTGVLDRRGKVPVLVIREVG